MMRVMMIHVHMVNMTLTNGLHIGDR